MDIQRVIACYYVRKPYHFFSSVIKSYFIEKYCFISLNISCKINNNFFLSALFFLLLYHFASVSICIIVPTYLLSCSLTCILSVMWFSRHNKGLLWLFRPIRINPFPDIQSYVWCGGLRRQLDHVAICCTEALLFIRSSLEDLIVGAAAVSGCSQEGLVVQKAFAQVQLKTFFQHGQLDEGWVVCPLADIMSGVECQVDVAVLFHWDHVLWWM